MIVTKEPAPLVCPHCSFEVLSFKRESEDGEFSVECQHVAFHIDDGGCMDLAAALDQTQIDTVRADARLAGATDDVLVESDIRTMILRLEASGYRGAESQPVLGLGIAAWVVFLPA